MAELKGKEKPAAEALEKLLEELGRAASWKPGEDPPDLEFVVEFAAFDMAHECQCGPGSFLVRRGPAARGLAATSRRVAAHGPKALHAGIHIGQMDEFLDGVFKARDVDQ